MGADFYYAPVGSRCIFRPTCGRVSVSEPADAGHSACIRGRTTSARTIRLSVPGGGARGLCLDGLGRGDRWRRLIVHAFVLGRATRCEFHVARRRSPARAQAATTTKTTQEILRGVVSGRCQAPSGPVGGAMPLWCYFLLFWALSSTICLTPRRTSFA